jgi:hypothetical protein
VRAGASALKLLTDVDLTGVPQNEQGTYLLGEIPAKYLSIQAKNTTGSTQSVGKVVYVTGSQGGNATFALADKSQEATSSKTFGLLGSNVTDNAIVSVITKGRYKFNGLDTSSFTEGGALWLGTNGDLTQTKPVAPDHAVFIGWLIIKGTNSTIDIDIQNGYELEELHDVLITNPQEGQFLQREGALWKNKYTWDYLVTNWSVEPTLNTTITGGEVYNYTLNGTTRYRFVPTTYDPTQDAFYGSFNGATLLDLIVTRG